MYLEGSDPTLPGDKACIELDAGITIDNSNDDLCLKYAYHAYGDTAAKLEIFETVSNK